MSLSKVYERFLASPSEAALADDRASINYITTLTTINGAGPIVKHLAIQAKIVKRKSEKVISAVEGASGLCLDVETTLEFVSGGGAFLPGLDDNFLVDRVVTFPVVHIVHFDVDQKIKQIRMYWDQGSLLKQVEVIGARSKSWPIRDGKDQVRLISTSASVAGSSFGSVTATPSISSASSVQDPNEVVIRSRSSRSSVSATGDPHASLSLFQSRDPNEEEPRSRITSRGSSANPPPREYSELFVGADAEATSPSKSPRKNGIPVKAGSSKNFQPIRLFDEDEQEAHEKIKTNPHKFQHFAIGDDHQEQEAAHTEEEEERPIRPERIKTNPHKYQHFELDDGEETPKNKGPAKNPKHLSQWDFEDFVTPEKFASKVRGHEVRHFGWSDDEVEESPVRRPVVHQPRPDAKTHFDFNDDHTPEAQRQKEMPIKGRMVNKSLGLYKDHVVDNENDDNDDTPNASKKPLGNVSTTRINNENRLKDFGPHWEMTDEVPAKKEAASDENKKPLAADKRKVLNSLNPSWGLYEESPDRARGIKLGGNGMGGRKDMTSSWGIGNESDPEQDEKFQHQRQSRSRTAAPKPQHTKQWDF